MPVYSQIKKKRNSTTGRSMVEMIAVLAIMGILSLGALSGVNYVKDRNVANQILKEALTQASEIQTTHRIKTETNSLEIRYGQASSSEYIRSRAFTNNERNKIVLRAFNVSEGVCKKIVSAEPVETFNCITLGKDTSTCDNENNNVSPDNCDNISNDIAFIADAKVREGSVVDPCSGVNCTDGKVCLNGFCVCPSGTIENEDGKCIKCSEPQKTACNINDRWDSNGCQIWEHHDCTPNDCNLSTGKCCPDGEKYNAIAQICCPDLSSWNDCDKITEAKKGVCPTRTQQCEDDRCNTTTGACCPSGQTYDLTARMCCSSVTITNACDKTTDARLNVCPTREKQCDDIYCNTKTKACCPKGLQYGVQQIFSKGDCICPGNTVKRSDGECVCPTAGMVLNAAKTACTCPSGTTITADQKSCICPAGPKYGVVPIFDKGNCICPGNTVKNTDGECVCPTAGMVLNSSKTNCVCPSGQTYDAIAKKCCGTPTQTNVCDTLVAASNGVCPTRKKQCDNNICNTKTKACCPKGRQYGVQQIFSNGSCVCPGNTKKNSSGECVCPTGMVLNSSKSACICPTVDGKQLTEKNGKCLCPEKTLSISLTYPSRCSANSSGYCSLSSKRFPYGEDPCTYRSSKTIKLDGTYRIRYSSGNLNYRNISGLPNNYTDAYLLIGQNQFIFSNGCHEKSSISDFKSCAQASSHVSTKELHGEYYLYAIDDLCYDNDANSSITIKFQKLINGCTPKD